MTADCTCRWDRYSPTCPRLLHRALSTRPEPQTAPPVAEWFVPVAWQEPEGVGK